METTQSSSRSLVHDRMVWLGGAKFLFPVSPPPSSFSSRCLPIQLDCPILLIGCPHRDTADSAKTAATTPWRLKRVLRRNTFEADFPSRYQRTSTFLPTHTATSPPRPHTCASSLYRGCASTPPFLFSLLLVTSYCLSCPLRTHDQARSIPRRRWCAQFPP